MASFKAEVIADDSGKWCSNALRFATREEAEAYARGLAWRWSLVREWRVVESDDEVYGGLLGHMVTFREVAVEGTTEPEEEEG